MGIGRAGTLLLLAIGGGWGNSPVLGDGLGLGLVKVRVGVRVGDRVG